METVNLGLYPTIWDINSREIIPFEFFIDHVKTGHWQDLIIPIRAIKDKKERDKLKDKLPSVTLSGTFEKRYDSNLIQHSGFIGIDIDDLGDKVQELKDLIVQDEYTYCVFVSCSGYGLCVVVRIEAEKHRDAYLSIADYYLKKFKQAIDPTGINVSRPRFVSFDPYLFLNEKAKTFKKYLPKEKKQAPLPIVFVQNEFDDIVKQMVDRRVNCCEDYRDWLRVCFALCSKFGDAGRNYFHSLSAISAKYSPEVCDKQYDVALKHDKDWGKGKVTLSTIYYYAKQAGINIASAVTKKVISVTASLKKGGQGIDSIISNLEKFGGIPSDESKHIVEQAYQTNQDADENDIDSVITWLHSNYTLRFNIISQRLEDNGVGMQERDINTMYLNCKKVFEKLSRDIFNSVLFSRYIPDYNPFLEWWENHKDIAYNDEIDKFWQCVHVRGDENDYERMVYFGTKWLVGIISGIYGDASPIEFVLASEEHGTGKTRFFRRLLPQAWRTPTDYYSESRLDVKEADEAMIMCSKLLNMDDEYGGKSRKEQKRLKALTDKEVYSVRLPYGRGIVDMRRLAGFGGTSNEPDTILTDSTGNRRVVPVHVARVDWETMNTIDRDAMWAQLFRLYHEGFVWQILGTDISLLGERNDKFVEYSLEYDLVNQYFESATGPGINVQEMTGGRIKEILDKLSNQKVNLNKLGQELKRLGYIQVIKKISGKTQRIYYVVEKGKSIDLPPAPIFSDDNPF